MAKDNRRYRLKRKWPVMVLLVLVLCTLGGSYLYAKYLLLSPIVPSKPDGEEQTQTISGRVNFLLLGIDARKGETASRSDSIILASVDAESKQASMLSIPRDTRVRIPKHGMDKINSAIAYGGPETTVDIVEDLLGVPMDYYVVTNFNGFKDIVDTLGGVTIDVEKDMYYYDPTDKFLINLKKGVQRMDGDKSIQYVRFRMDALGDISRTQRQQKFLEALAKEMLQPSTIAKLPKLIPQINRNVETNLGLMDMLALARAAKDLDNMNIISETLPGNFLDIDGVSYWGVDSQKAKLAVADLFRGEKAASMVLENSSTNVASKTGSSQTSQAEDDDKNSLSVNQEQEHDRITKEVYDSETGTDTKNSGNSKTGAAKKDGANHTDTKNAHSTTHSSVPVEVDVSITPVTVPEPTDKEDQSTKDNLTDTAGTPADIEKIIESSTDNTSGG
ncbi:cell envelope-related transcriptional attenuator [Desulfofarcimen acetoxidans DSM 771]|jgi:LCP family protein required for cell wall assembly|uniref:Cell envelope-related transcriptional attenuator n=1 Tax=Desulfofarcimen acetoxidans (strain ATCC 49208 / DSM 771 / KCTC 5769 / VKM B-1644 / 5575) TaxID=485916 RepID=C8VYR9_DESAS|nr:LCP family protein [Desulfofarcimen acetoxidans]ACV64790.1 cell envelope-related transcriptional attenuator [Desulfofarcimen acetoxidans DSM 771]